MNGVKIGILGAGTFGMALASMLSGNNADVEIWTRHAEKLENYDKTRIYPPLKNMAIPKSVVFTGSLEKVCSDKDILLFAVPSVYVREVAGDAAGFIREGQLIVNAGKGMEADTLFTLTEVIEDELSKTGKRVRTVAISGPTHAEEVAKKLPSTIVSASEDTDAARYVQDVFMNEYMRVYTNSDKKGVELCGAMKNIMALAAGMSEGMGYGDNAKAALITRGLTEIARLGIAMGCRIETFAGLAGVGDLIVTATSKNSRNNRAGVLIGSGVPVTEAVRRIGMVVEGINAIPAALNLAKKYDIEMPLTFAVNDVINHGADPAAAVNGLMMRDKKNETDGWI